MIGILLKLIIKLFGIMDFFPCFIVLPDRIRIDKGTEIGEMATIHSYLRGKQGDLEHATESILYGPSTQNKIEKWWRELLEPMKNFLKPSCQPLQRMGIMIQVMRLTGDKILSLYCRGGNFLFNSLVPSDKCSVYFTCPDDETICPKKVGNSSLGFQKSFF